ncbi:MAG: hypothetical protein LUG21_08445, partial [Clostridiales bacterium]|nr:hypothetical protein [Clostridiales bacterium]
MTIEDLYDTFTNINEYTEISFFRDTDFKEKIENKTSLRLDELNDNEFMATISSWRITKYSDDCIDEMDVCLQKDYSKYIVE